MGKGDVNVSFRGTEIFNFTPSEYEEFLDENVLHIANMFFDMVRNKAISQLGSTKEKYIDNVFLNKNSNANYSVGLNKNSFIANALEGGMSPYDMKLGLLASPKAKVGKNGSKYIDVPIKSKFDSSLIAKRFEVGDLMTKKNLPKRNIKSRAQRKSIVRGGETLFESYRHKSSKLMRGTVKSKSGQQGTALVFRRVSSNSDALAFVSKGLRARNFFKKSLAELKYELKF